MYKKPQNWIGMLALCILLVLILVFSGNGFKFDEPYYLSNVDLLKQYGFSRYFIIHLQGPAGPTYAVLHYLLSPLTGLKVIPVRLVNFCLLIFTMDLLNRILKRACQPLTSLGMLSIPMTFVCAGMALTEVPALFFLVLSIYLLQGSIQKQNIFLLIAGALSYSFGILGRQPYLLLLPVFILFAFYRFSFRSIGLLIIFLLISLILPVYCFCLWHGLIPQTGRVAEEGGFVYTHFFLSCGYCFLAFLFTTPTFIIPPKRIGYFTLILVLLGLIGISVYFNLHYAVMDTLTEKILPSRFLPRFLNLCFGLLLFMSFYFILNCIYRFFESYKTSILLVSFLSLFILLLSTITITHQFSSRYVFQLSPFIIIVGARYNKTDLYSNILRILGVLLGVSSLVSYFLSTYRK